MAQVFTIVWAGEIGDLRLFLADKPGHFSVNSEGVGRNLRIDITQRMDGLEYPRRVRARIGDTLVFDDDGLIHVVPSDVVPSEPTDPFEQDGLFAVDVPMAVVVPDPFDGLSADRRRTLRRLETLTAGFHPITKLALHSQAAPVDDRDAPGRRCGNCKFRSSLYHHNRNWPKCWNPADLGADEVDVLGYPFITNGAGTDVPAWMPACRDHSYGEPKLSDDAARYVPEAVSAR